MRGSRWRSLTAALVTMLLAGGVLAGAAVPAGAATAAGVRPRIWFPHGKPKVKSAAGERLAGQAGTRARDAARQRARRLLAREPGVAAVAYRPSRAVWPAAGRQTAALTAVVPARDRGLAGQEVLAARGFQPAGRLAVGVARAAGGAVTGVAGVSVTVARHRASLAAGSDGEVFSVAPSGRRGGGGPVRVRVDYAQWAKAYGGDFESRLHLVVLPACALSTPQLAVCRAGSPMASVNDTAAGTLTATVQLGGAAGEPWSPLLAGSKELALTRALAAAADPGQQVVMAVESGASGPEGNYAAAPVNPAGSWVTQQGDFTYSYPIATPPALEGSAPSVSLDYDSQSIDGETAAANTQGGWIGDGWSLPTGSVTVAYTGCSDVSAAPADDSGSECWDGQNATLTLNGQSAPLVDNGGTWVPQDDNGETVTQGSGANNGLYNGEYWKVTTTDGTQYYFGYDHVPGDSSSSLDTNAAWGVPVINPASGDPCYSSSSGSSSQCTMGWQWNLDYVIDPQGNLTVYTYNDETNEYALGGEPGGPAGTLTSYVRGGYLHSIQYGWQAAQAEAGDLPAGEVAFTSSQRCTGSSFTTAPCDSYSNLTSSTASDWPDTPADEICPELSGGSCTNYSPTFFSTYMLTGITTEVAEGATPALKPVDQWSLTQSFPAGSGEGDQAVIFLNSIQRTGEDPQGSAAANLPAVNFGTPDEIDNQVPGSSYPPLFRPRIESVTTETGAEIGVLYKADACVQGDDGSPPAAFGNTLPCFPVWWAPSGESPSWDWFNKSLVSQVSVSDLTGADSPTQITSYSYLGGAAWHQDDNLVVTPAQRTWDVYRGFAQVETTTGTAPDPVTETVDTYMQGMDGDGNSSGGTTSATVSYASNGPDAGQSVPDYDWLAGQVLEADTYSRSGGSLQQAVISSWPTQATQTASQSWPSGSGLPSGTSLDAFMPTSQATDTETALASDTSGGWGQDTVTSYYDQYDRVTAAATVPSSGASTCTQTEYASPSASNSNLQMLSYPEETYTVTGGASGGSCGQPSQSSIVAETLDYYDDESSTDASPGTGTWGMVQQDGGLLTAEQKLTAWPASTGSNWVTTATHYDSYGQVVWQEDGDGNITTTAYGYTTGSTGELPVSETVTNPKSWTTTTGLDQARQLPLTVTDPNNEVTTETYDDMGRLLSVTPPADQAAGYAEYKYGYDISDTAPSAVETQTVRANGSYQKAFTIYDGMAQEIQEQTQPVNNAGGMILFADTSYNSDGWAVSSTAPYATEDATTPSATLLVPDLAEVPDQTVTGYDGMGRAISTTLEDDNAQVSQSTTAYPGVNQADVTPPAGGTATSTFTNPLGQTTASWSYSGSATPNDQASSADITTYTYTPGGQTATVADANGNTWTYAYNLLGEKISATDPGMTGTATTGSDSTAGTTTYAYDADGNLTSQTQPDGTVLTYSYDALGRETEQANATPGLAGEPVELDSWSYDSTPLNGSGKTLGQLSSQTSYDAAGHAYTETVTGYDTAYQPTGASTSIPAVDGTPGGTYTNSFGYNSLSGTMASASYGADGGLPAETVTYTWGLNGLLSGFGDSTDYLDAATYDPEGDVQQANFGPSGEELAEAYTTDAATGRLTLQATSLQANSAVTTDENAYTYSQAGDLTSADAVIDPDSATPTQDLQCFAYNDLQELKTAWTDSGQVTPAAPPAASPAPGGTGACEDTNPGASNIGGSAPYWDSYTYDALGDRTSETINATSDQAASTQTLAYPGSDGTQAAAQPDADTSITTTAGSTSAVTTPGYDANGDTTSSTTTGTAAPLVSAVQPSSGSLCLDDSGGSTTAGNKIDIYTCNGTSSQDVTANANSTIEVEGNCLDVSGNGTTSGTAVVLEPCSTSTAGEIWHAGTSGSWVNPNSGMCLTDPGDITTTGTALQIQACSTGSSGQDWASQQVQYNALGEVSEVISPSGASDTTSTYQYDAAGNLIVQDDNGAVTYYADAGAEEIHYTGSSLTGAQRFYTDSPDGTTIIRTTAGGGQVYYQLDNQQGTGTELIQASNDAITRRYYDPYGNQLTTGGTWPDNQAFLDQPADPDTGLDLLGARQYNPVTGRFLSLDPVFEVGQPTQMGGYTYAADNPTSGSDPSGLCIDDDGNYYCPTANNTSKGQASPDRPFVNPCPSYDYGCPGYAYPDPTEPSGPSGVESSLTPTQHAAFVHTVRSIFGTASAPAWAQWKALSDVCDSFDGTCAAGVENLSLADYTLAWAAHWPANSNLDFGSIVRWAERNRVSIADWSALAACITPGVDLAACGVAQGAAYAIRASARIQAEGFEKSLPDNLGDYIITAGGFAVGGALSGEGLAATVPEGQEITPPVELFPRFPARQLAFNMLGSQTDLVQLVLSNIPGSKPAKEWSNP